MSNRSPVILPTEPEWIASLSDFEAAQHGLCLFPGFGRRRGHPPETQAIENLCPDTEMLAFCHVWLSDVSGFMRRLIRRGQSKAGRGLLPRFSSRAIHADSGSVHRSGPNSSKSSRQIATARSFLFQPIGPLPTVGQG